MPRVFIFPLALTLACALLATSGAPAVAADKRDKKREEELRKLPVPPPQPVTQEVAVKRGEQLEIKLKIWGQRTENLKYLIRGGPEKGKLTEPRVLSQETSVVTYRPPTDLTVTRDRFLYSVQTTAGVSAPVEVNIKIVDDEAHLIVPDLLDFAAQLAGTAAFKEIEISNIGGSVSDGEVKVPAPWRIEGPAAYRLTAGAKQKFLIFFEPKEGGVFRGEIHYTSQVDHVTTLRGISQAAITANPPALALEAASGEVKRVGRLELMNNTAADQEVTLEAPDRLHVAKTLKLPAGGKDQVTVEVDEADPALLDETLLVHGAGISVRVPVRAAPVGAVLRTNAPVVQMPLVRRGQPAATVVSVENVGGAPGFWKTEVEPPFGAEPASVRLQPKEKREIRVSLLSDDTGPVRGWLRFTGEAQTREVRLEAEVVSARNPAPPSAGVNRANSSRRENTANSESPEAAEAAAAAAADARLAPLIYLRDNVSVTHITPNAATVEWPASLGGARAFRLERRSVGIDDQGHLRTDWTAPPAVQIRENGGRMFAEMRDLRPSSRHTVRIRPVSEGGEAGPPLFITQFETAPPKRGGGALTPFGIGVFVLALVAIGAFVWQKMRQPKK